MSTPNGHQSAGEVPTVMRMAGGPSQPSVHSHRIAQPSAFPKPTISICLIRSVEVVEPDGSISVVTALESEWGGATNGNGVRGNAVGGNTSYIDAAEFAGYAYPTNGDASHSAAKDEQGRVAYSHYYELTREIKETIFGSVHHGLILIPYGNKFVRVRPYKEVAVKVYFKTRLRSMRGRTHENPLCEIAAMQVSPCLNFKGLYLYTTALK